MRQAESRSLRPRSDNKPGGKEQGDCPAATSPSVSATDIDALFQPEPGTRSKQPRRTQRRKAHDHVGQGGQKAPSVNGYRTRSSTTRDRVAGKQTEVYATGTVTPPTTVSKRQGKAAAHKRSNSADPSKKASSLSSHEALGKSPRSKVSYHVSPSSTSSTVRDKQQALIEQEAAKKRKAMDEYNATGDPSVFAPFLAPFISTKSGGRCGKRRKLGEWQWDSEIERHWREDKTSGKLGARIWAPVEESFL